MTTLKLSTTASPLMQAVLPRSLSPLDIARRPGCTALGVMRPDLMTGGAAVSAVTNLSDPARPFEQATPANQPTVAEDAAFGRGTLVFDPDRARFLTLRGAVSYAGPFSILAVYRSPVAGDSFDAIAGAFSSVDADQAALVQRSNGQLQAHYAEALAGSPISAPDTWSVGLMTYDGSASVRLRLNGGATVAATSVSEPTGTAFRIGNNVSTLGLRGRVDMAALFSLDLLAAANATLFADLKVMLRRFYGSAVPALA